MSAGAWSPIEGIPPLGDGIPWPAAAELGPRIRRLVAGFPVRGTSNGALRRAAVALVLAPDAAGRLSFVLTRRSRRLRRHAGQWALPGGGVDPGETVERAALRELREELGLRLADDAVLGRLDDYATRSGFLITPVVLWSSERPRYDPDPDEVELVLEVPVESFDRPDVPRLRAIPESQRPVLSVPVGDSWVHAPTAAVVFQLFELVRGRLHRVDGYEQPVFAWR